MFFLFIYVVILGILSSSKVLSKNLLNNMNFQMPGMIILDIPYCHARMPTIAL